MTKRFALPDTLPDPYFTIDAGAAATLTVKVGPCATNGADRMAVEVWRDGLPLCRVFAKSAQVVGEANQPASCAGNNWNTHPPGGAYRSRLGQTGRPDLSGRLDDLARRVEGAIEEAFRRHTCREAGQPEPGATEQGSRSGLTGLENQTILNRAGVRRIRCRTR